MKLEVGKKYESEGGTVYEVVHIVGYKPGLCYPVVALEIKSCAVKTFTLVGEYDISVNSKGANNLVREHIEVPVICGYSREQWKTIMVGDFLCGFSNNVPQKALTIQTLSSIVSAEEGHNFIAYGGTTWANCSPVRRAGIRQPWFGGEQPVPDGTQILVGWRNGGTLRGFAHSFGWWHSGADEDVVEFVYLETSDGR